MIITLLSPSAVPCIESFCDVFPVVLLCCGSGDCIDVPLLLLFVAVDGCISASVDGDAPLFYFSIISGCSGGGCIDVSLTLVFVNVGSSNSTALEVVPLVVATIGVPIGVLAMELPGALSPFVIVASIVILPFLLFLSGCGSGSCVDVPLLPLLFVGIVGFVSTGVDGNALMLFVFVVSGCGGGGCIDVSSTLVFVNVGGCNSAGLEAVPIFVVAMGAPVVVLAMELPNVLLPLSSRRIAASWQWQCPSLSRQWGHPLLFWQWSHPCPFWSL
jgi:hypothetical protein